MIKFSISNFQFPILYLKSKIQNLVAAGFSLRNSLTLKGAAALFLLFLIVISCSSPESTSTKPQTSKPASDFALKDITGKEVKLGSLKGKAVMVNFWATWCYPCREEIPDLQKSYEENKDKGFIILGVNIKENESKVSKFAEDYKITYPVLLDIDGSVSNKYQVFGVPMSFFIDKNGIIKDSFVGMMTKEDIAKRLEAIL
ncbi:MAG: TlpA family protein disulfide reductase [Nitrospinae bacterium]|nr:TlpA family protein disulfide reductase [Nitrospinota bacterium]MBI3813456.1 TlpA family protein disulfide reductase [Nitrospinota bacterium]